jgi:hypothetical protein
VTKTGLDLQRERAATNQSLFREVNERIEDLSRSASYTSFVCECQDETCDETLPLTVEEYEHVRAAPDTFFVLPGHEVAAVEEVTERAERYLIVRKLGVGSGVAAGFDPRRRV